MTCFRQSGRFPVAPDGISSLRCDRSTVDAPCVRSVVEAVLETARATRPPVSADGQQLSRQLDRFERCVLSAIVPGGAGKATIQGIVLSAGPGRSHHIP
jgi:hypothetical protein